MNDVWLVLASALVGCALWSPSEYLLHRFAMHSQGGQGPVAGEHRRHHRDPEATALPMRMLLHLAVYALVAVVAFGLAQILPTGVTVGLALGYAGGFAAYEILHWRSHHRAPGWRYTRWLRRHHLEHHRHARRAFGVTTPLWDQIFGTT